MRFALDWFSKKENLTGIAQGFIGNAVFAIVLAGGAMLWSYVQGMPAPWVAITGVTALGAVFFAIRQWISLSRGIGKLPLQERVATLEGELSDARAKIAAAESEERRIKKSEDEWQKQNVGRIDRFHATKDALKGHIDEASRATNFDDMSAWTAAANHLLGQLRLGEVPNRLHEHADDAHKKRWFQENVAHLRSLLAKLKYTDMPWQ